MANNTVVNQSSFDDICNHYDNVTQNCGHNITTEQIPLTSRSNNMQINNRLSTLSANGVCCKDCHLEKEKR